MSDTSPKGILRNKPEGYVEETEFPDKLDRNEGDQKHQIECPIGIRKF